MLWASQGIELTSVIVNILKMPKVITDICFTHAVLITEALHSLTELCFSLLNAGENRVNVNCGGNFITAYIPHTVLDFLQNFLFSFDVLASNFSSKFSGK